jgi:hypothetical protein
MGEVHNHRDRRSARLLYGMTFTPGVELLLGRTEDDEVSTIHDVEGDVRDALLYLCWRPEE